MMNGSIKVHSAPKQGTKITVTIFLKLQESEKEQAEAAGKKEKPE